LDSYQSLDSLPQSSYAAGANLRWLTLLLIITAFAGCAEDRVEDTPDLPPGINTEDAQLHGFVFDPTVFALEGVTIEVLDTAQTATTDAEGRYELDGVPTGVPVLLVASKAGYDTSSKTITLEPEVPIRLNFTLNPVPVKTPTDVAIKFNGAIDCESKVIVNENEIPGDCGSDNANVWEFNVNEDLAGAVIEVAWIPGTDLANSLGATLETLGFGDQNIIIAETFGTSPLRLQIPNAVAEKYYSEAGSMRLTVEVRPDNESNEAGAGVGAAASQQFNAVASLFYVEGPPPGYSVA
jgi:hypothetical protein